MKLSMFTLIPKFGDLRDRQHWRLYSTVDINYDKKINEFMFENSNIVNHKVNQLNISQTGFEEIHVKMDLNWYDLYGS